MGGGGDGPKKRYKARTTAYIQYDKVQEIIDSEPPRHALCIEMLFWLGMRASEVIGKYSDYKNRPGIRPCDIDIELHPEWGCNHTVRIWRKRGKFEIMPLTDEMYNKLQSFVKDYNDNVARENKDIRKLNLLRESKGKPPMPLAVPIGKEDRIFPYHRTTVYGWLSKYGQCVDSRYRIGIHVLRRSFGKEYRRRGGSIEKLQKIYSHENMQQTQKYIGEVKDEAMKEYSKLFGGNKPE